MLLNPVGRTEPDIFLVLEKAKPAKVLMEVEEKDLNWFHGKLRTRPTVQPKKEYYLALNFMYSV